MDLITDRQESDVLLGSAKGRYGYEDLNRVESAVSLLCTQMEKLDIYLPLIVKTDWASAGDFSPETWPTKTQMERYLQNIRTLAGALRLSPELPENMDNLDFLNANNIELALEQADIRLRGVLDTHQFSGELYAGEENRI